LFERVLVGKLYFATRGNTSAKASEFLCVALEFIFDDHGIEIAVCRRVGCDNYFVGLAVQLFPDNVLEVAHAQLLGRIEDATLGQLTNDQIATIKPPCSFDRHEVGFFLNYHDDILHSVWIFADTTEASFVGMNEETISTYLDGGEVDDAPCRFVNLTFTASDQKEGEPCRLPWSNTWQFCKYVDEVADLLWEHKEWGWRLEVRGMKIKMRRLSGSLIFASYPRSHIS